MNQFGRSVNGNFNPTTVTKIVSHDMFLSMLHCMYCLCDIGLLKIFCILELSFCYSCSCCN